MQGYQITFFTQQNRRHGSTPVCDWLLDVAKELALPGATVIGAAKGFGHSGRLHSAGFFDLADQPQMVVMTASDEQAQALLARVTAAGLHLFHVKTPVEFGVLGDSSD